MIFNLCVLIVMIACVAAITWALTAEREWSAGFEKGYALAKAHAEKHRTIDAATERMAGGLAMLEALNAQAERQVLACEFPQRTIH
jgi:hypothetical protein